MKKLEINLDDNIYDYLKKRAKEANEEYGIELTAEDIAVGILIVRKEQEEKNENSIEKHQSQN